MSAKGGVHQGRLCALIRLVWGRGFGSFACFVLWHRLDRRPAIIISFDKQKIQKSDSKAFICQMSVSRIILVSLPARLGVGWRGCAGLTFPPPIPPHGCGRMGVQRSPGLSSLPLGHHDEALGGLPKAEQLARNVICDGDPPRARPGSPPESGGGSCHKVKQEPM